MEHRENVMILGNVSNINVDSERDEKENPEDAERDDSYFRKSISKGLP